MPHSIAEISAAVQKTVAHLRTLYVAAALTGWNAAAHSTPENLKAAADARTAAIQLPGSSLKSGATSTAVGSAILQAITVQTGALLSARGHQPPVWVSANLPNGDDHNNELLTRYRPYLARYQMATMSKPGHK